MKTVAARLAQALQAITSFASRFRIKPTESFTRQSAVDVLYVDSDGRVVGHRRGIKLERFTRL